MRSYTDMIDYLIELAPNLAQAGIDCNCERLSVQVVAYAFSQHPRVVAHDIELRAKKRKRAKVLRLITTGEKDD